MGKQPIIKNIPIWFAFLFIILIYTIFRIKIHTWESYWFASGLEGLFEVRSIYDMYQGTSSNPVSINIYHPNHPLLHYLAYIIYKFIHNFYTNIRSLDIIQLINMSFSFVGLYYIYKIIRLQSSSRTIIVLSLFLFAFCDIFWYYAMSGEVYIAPHSISVIIFYYLLLIYNSAINNSSNTKNIILTGVLLGFAISFHQLYSPLAFIIILYFMYIKIKNKNFRFIKNIMTIVLFSTTIVSIFIILGNFSINKIHSLNSFINTLFMGSPHKITFHGIDYYRSIHIFITSYYKLNSMFNSMIRTSSLLSLFYKISIVLLFSFSIIYLALKNLIKSTFPVLCMIWLLVFFIFIGVYTTDKADDYWMPVIFPFLMIILFAIINNSSKILSILLSIIIVVSLYINFFEDIYPKSQAKLTDFALSAQEGNSIIHYDSFLFVLNLENENIYDELWYVNYVLKKKNVLLKSPPLEYDIIDKIYYENALRQLKRGQIPKAFMIIASPEYAKGPLKECLLFNNIDFTEKHINKKESTKYEKLAGYPFGYHPMKSFDNSIVLIYCKSTK